MPAYFIISLIENFHYIIAGVIFLATISASFDGIICLVYRYKVAFVKINNEELENWASLHKIKYKIRGDYVRFKKADDASLFKLTFV